ncbi:hypothetical protein AOQ84DRAFT_342781 [Glonium stellatum]|uniref:DUF7962 domain-containing protein n=1 Tax=Glonium stellatum TaxID=574774 RepID=A0A8E2JRC4_9PEZI|nr:hypothetical protein AOQ84DRAFT_342781 [Glonium stellatum]
MMPRPILRNAFNVTYRKIPVLALGREVYCDTSIILEALEHFFPAPAHPSLYPRAADGRDNRALMRGFASYWTDRPLFRVTTGLIPSSVWRTSFGADRGQLIGHKLDADKLEKKVPRNLSSLDLHLSLLEPQLRQSMNAEKPWIFSTPTPSLADLSLGYQLRWGIDIAAGRGIYNLTGGGTSDTSAPVTDAVFNSSRYPAVLSWFEAFESFVSKLPSTETRVEEGSNGSTWQNDIAQCAARTDAELLLPTPAPPHVESDRNLGLVPGAQVSVAPDDTGRDDPTFGTLVALSPEEVVIQPRETQGDEKRGWRVNVRIHFPRLGFVVRPIDSKANL